VRERFREGHQCHREGLAGRLEQSAIWIICKITEARGFDWQAFDPVKPETFVDSPQNMLPLHMKFHRSPTHGIHHRSFPT
jgi:hypothetical protein